MEELKPYNEASKAQRAEKTNFDSRWSDLDFKNEQQLDEVIASIDYRLSHETNSVADEKKLIAELKKLGVGPSLYTTPCVSLLQRSHQQHMTISERPHVLTTIADICISGRPASQPW